MRWPKLFLAIGLLMLAACSDDTEETANTIPPEVAVSGDFYRAAQLAIETEDRRAVDSKEQYTACQILLTSNREDRNYEGSARIRWRGNSTWLWYPKKPYRVKLDERAEYLDGVAADY